MPESFGSTGRPESIWKAAAEPSTHAPLARDVECDVVIVGGGITGILCAHLLRQRKLRVVLLEAHRVGEGATGNSTGNLYAMVGQSAHALADETLAARVWKSRAMAVERLAHIVRDERLDCDFVRRPFVLFSETRADDPAFAGFARVAERAGVPLRDGAGDLPFPVKRALAADEQAQFNPLRFVRQLAARLATRGVSIHERTPALAIEPGRVATPHGQVRARWVVLATHTPKGALKVHAALAPYREYGVAFPAAGARLPDGICWDTASPRHSVRRYAFDGNGYLVVVGGSHKVGQHDDPRQCHAELERYAAQRFGVREAAYRWSAQGYRSADALPYIGASAVGENVLYASGYAADGLTYAAVAAPILAERIGGKEHSDAALYDPGRFTAVASAKALIAENVNVLEQYLKDVPGAADADEFAQVRRGHGKTLAKGGAKLAVHRDDDGRLHVVSAVCTHLQCIVAWNAAERSWDCPCHGSRFAVDGTVLEGPALAPLPPRAREG